MAAVRFDEKSWFDDPLPQWRYTVFQEFRCLVRDDGLELRISIPRWLATKRGLSPWASLGYPPNGGSLENPTREEMGDLCSMAKIPFDEKSYANLLSQGIPLIFEFPLELHKKASNYTQTFDKIIPFRKWLLPSFGGKQAQGSLKAHVEALTAKVHTLEQRINALMEARGNNE